MIIHADNMAAINTRMKLLFVLATTVSSAISTPTDGNPDLKETGTSIISKYDNFQATADKCQFPPSWMFMKPNKFEPCRNVVENDTDVLCSLVYKLTTVICEKHKTIHLNIQKELIVYGRLEKTIEQVCSDLKPALAKNTPLNVSNCTNVCSSMRVVCELNYIALNSFDRESEAPTTSAPASSSAENDKKKASRLVHNDKNGVPDNISQLTTSMADADVNKTKKLQDLGSQDFVTGDTQDRIDTNSNSLSEKIGLNPNNLTRGTGSNTNDPPGGTGSNPNNPPEGTGSNANDPPGGTGSNTSNLPGGTGSNANDLPGGTGSNTNNLSGGTGSNANDPPGGTGSNTNNLTGGTDSNTNNLPGGTGSNTNYLPGGTDSKANNLPGGTGSNTNNPPGGTGSNPNNPPEGTGFNPNNAPEGTGSNPNNPPEGTGSNTNDPPGGTDSNQNNPQEETVSNPNNPPEGTGSSRNNLPGGTGSMTNILPELRGSNQNDLPGQKGSKTNNPPVGTGSNTNDPPGGTGSNTNDPPGGTGSKTNILSGGDGGSKGNLQEGGDSNQGKTSTISSTETTRGNGINNQSNQQEQLTEGTKTNKKPTNTEEDNRQAETDQSVDKAVGSKENIYRNGNEDAIEIDGAPSSGNFMAYFLTAVVLCIAGYVVFHNKQKIFAFIIEGRTTRQRRRANGGGEYKKLQSNVEEVMPSLDKSTSARNFIY